MTNHQRYEFGPFTLDPCAHLLLRDGKALTLPPKCFELLCTLIREHGRLLPKNDLMSALWPNVFVEEANLPNLVTALRRYLNDSPRAPTYIQTVPKLGYRFVAATKVLNGHPKVTDNSVRARTTGQPVRILVFPFRSSPDLREREYLAYSLPDAIASMLSELQTFTVRSTQMAMRFDPHQWDPVTVAQQLDVDVILSGDISSTDEQLHVVTHLLEARTGTVLWSRGWDVSRRDLFAFQRAVVQLTVRHLFLSTADERHIATLDAPGDAEAYELYLRANSLLLNRSQENVLLARDLYLACTERDPAYAPAWARLARCYRLLEKFRHEPDTNFARARAALERAFALHPGLSVGYAAYASIESDAGNSQAAMLRILSRAATHRNDAEVFSGLVHACRYCGLMDASLGAHERAISLDPNIRTSVAHTYFALADYERALYWYGTGWGLYLDAASLASMGRVEECATLLWTRKEEHGDLPALMFSLDAWIGHDQNRGLAALRDPKFAALRDPEVRFYMARQAAAFGDIPLGNELLLRACNEGYLNSTGMQRDQWLEPLRATAEFKRTLHRVTEREAETREAFLAAGGDRICAQ